ncbi:MAG: hypothetical protein MZU84_02540 [Sphingobacterium sp.]|nr:hypothetical protein [Sphingobacterium sp.]
MTPPAWNRPGSIICHGVRWSGAKRFAITSSPVSRCRWRSCSPRAAGSRHSARRLRTVRRGVKRRTSSQRSMRPIPSVNCWCSMAISPRAHSVGCIRRARREGRASACCRTAALSASIRRMLRIR